MLDLSKVESSKIEFIPESFDLVQLVREVWDVLQTKIARKQPQFVAVIEPSLGKLVLEPARLKQVLYN